MDRLVFGMHHLNISQIGSLIDGKPHYSHPNYALDLCGEDHSVDFWFNKESGTQFVCTGSFGTKETGNTRFFVSCDEKGYVKKVMCADGKARVVTLAMTHSNKDYPIYHIYQPQEEMYREGTSGRCTGPHIHLEVAEGSVRTKYWDSKLKCYRMKGEMNPLDAFFILDGYTKVIDTKGLQFKHCTHTKVEDDMKDSTKLVEYAKTQLGKGGEDYWNYFGYKDDWCSEFVSYCGYKCGFVPGKMPKADTCLKAHAYYKPKHQLFKKSEYEPKVGDIVYFGKEGTDHTAIVAGTSATQIVVIEGNAGDPDFLKSKVCMTAYMRSDPWIWGYADPLTGEGEPYMKDLSKEIKDLPKTYAQGGVVPDEGLELTVPTKGTYLVITGHNSTPSLNTQWIVRTGGNTAFKISGTGTMVSVKVSDNKYITIKTTQGHPNVYVSRLDA